jgi:hypothetical protein
MGQRANRRKGSFERLMMKPTRRTARLPQAGRLVVNRYAKFGSLFFAAVRESECGTKRTRGMDRQITIRRLLAIFMIAGLVLAPVARPAMAGTTSDASMSAMTDDMSVSATADEMAGDMPCCPPKAPTPIGCDKCVFMAACAAKCFPGLTAALFQPPFAVSSGLARPQNDFWPDGLGHPPPEHPPRILV